MNKHAVMTQIQKERLNARPRSHSNRSKFQPSTSSLRDRMATAETVAELKTVLEEAERFHRASPSTRRKWKQTADVRMRELTAKEAV